MTQLHLLTPFQLGDLHLKNWVILVPMTRARAGKARSANALMAGYYRQQSSAVLISEATTISSQRMAGMNPQHVHGEVAAQC
ncbi:MAG: hypothetical protein NPIRA03_38610 [Nitrospirales bacterium]|nr:MAG: hypothetical protein NPIRA03_38610 [Nitrospirales bacterium]